MTGFKVVVDKSTVPVGTADKVRTVIAQELSSRQQNCILGGFQPRILKEGLQLKTLCDLIVL
jgi:UDPglucose 6-dehydrogenase